MRPRLRVRRAVNLANGSTLAGLGAAAIGGAEIARSVDGLFTGTGYRLPLPPAPAFCLGNVIVTRADVIVPGSRLFCHEARHATQFAWCGGVVMIPLYLAAAGVSWALTGDFGARNLFERWAGLADGGYTDKPLRPAIQRAADRLSRGRRVGAGRAGGPGRRAAGWGIGDHRIGAGRLIGPGRRTGARARPDPVRASGARDGWTASPSR